MLAWRTELTYQRPLTRPVVLDPLGKLYNKDAVLEFFLDRTRYGDGDKICGYLKGVKVSYLPFARRASTYDPGPAHSQPHTKPHLLPTRPIHNRLCLPARTLRLPPLTERDVGNSPFHCPKTMRLRLLRSCRPGRHSYSHPRSCC